MKLSEFSLILLFAFIPCVLGVIPGGISEIPVDDPEVIRLSQVALLKVNEGKQGADTMKIHEIVKASRQIVSGTLTRLTFRVSNGVESKLCEVKIWEQPWLNKTEVTLESCTDDNSTPGNTVRQNVSKNGDLTFNLFNDFLRIHNKIYEDEKEYSKRFHIFRANLKKIKLLRKLEQGTAQYGLTWFSDLSNSEFQKYLGLKRSESNDVLPLPEIPNIELPDEYDWRNYNAVSPVKDQKDCGSCWAFSVTGNVEGQWAIKKHELLSLSEQELIDCDSYDNGCNGGEMTLAYKAIMKLGGLETESDYPYEAKSETCHFNRNKTKVQISGAVNISNDEVQMAKWLVKNGPISIGLNANAMQFYFGGVSHPKKFLCSPANLDHGVLIVGFGIHHSVILRRTLPYWIIKNSWGNHWGERGYYRLYRGDGSCGVNQYVTSAVIN